MVNKIALGTVQFGLDYGISNEQGMTSDQDLFKILQSASSKGIDTLDTAYAYGASQKRLGQFDLSAFKIVSKFIVPKPDLSLDQQLRESLNLLQITSLYGFLAHKPFALIEQPRLWGELKAMKEKGLIKKIGFSFNTVAEVKEIEKRGLEPDLIQVPFNVLDQRFVKSMMKFKEKGCEIHTRSSFLQGLFFCKPEQLSDHFKKVKPFLRTLKSIDIDLPQELLTYCVKQNFVDRVVMGVNNHDQLISNLISDKNSSILSNMDLPNLGDEILSPSNWPK